MKYKEIIEKMTLEEKASLMSGANFWNTKSIERVGIPGMMLTDGPHGLRKQGGKADHLGLNKSIPATCYPSAAGLANSWNEELLEEMGEALGLEAASEQVSVLLGPGVNIKRSPLCGRNFEYFSEDPYLSGKMAAALIRGIQKNGIAACVKHFAANSQEHLRMTNDSVVDERTLREIYLPAFEMAVKEGQTKCLMTSYNKVNGTYTHEHGHLLKEILYGEWDYQGMVVSDWGGNNDRVASVKAGGTLEMPSANGETDRHIVAAIKHGELEEAVLDEQVDRLLDVIFSTQPHIQGKNYSKEEHHNLAAKIAQETAVLLKNEDQILPLKKDTKVALIGDFANYPRYQGAGSSRIAPAKLDTARDVFPQNGIHVIGYAAGFRRGGKRDARLIHEACQLAGKAEIVVLYLGLDEGGEAEGVDRSDMKLPANQIQLLEALAQANPNIVVVLSCGCSVEMEWDCHAKAVLHGYLGGQGGARAQAAILTGEVNPSGKLSETYPFALEDTSCAAYYPGEEATSEYREGIYVGYRYFDTADKPVKYPFGYGLSYTSFTYSNLSIQDDRVSFTIKNTGTVAGAEVAQLYVAGKTQGIFRPVQELKGFVKVWLKPQEEKEVWIRLNNRSFAVWSILKHDWVIEPGFYEIRIGASSRDIRLSQCIEKNGEKIENPYTDPALETYYSGLVTRVPNHAFEALLGRTIPKAKWNRSAPMEFNSVVGQGAYLKSGLGRVLYNIISLIQKSSLRLGKKEMANSVMFLMNMPYRGIARMSGLFTDAQMYALLKVINREKGGWKAFFLSFRRKI